MNYWNERYEEGRIDGTAGVRFADLNNGVWLVRSQYPNVLSSSRSPSIKPREQDPWIT